MRKFSQQHFWSKTLKNLKRRFKQYFSLFSPISQDMSITECLMGLVYWIHLYSFGKMHFLSVVNVIKCNNLDLHLIENSLAFSNVRINSKSENKSMDMLWIF